MNRRKLRVTIVTLKNEKHILVIWVIEQHKDNDKDNDLKMLSNTE